MCASPNATPDGCMRGIALGPKSAEMSGRRLIRHGKYKGMLTFEQLAACDKDYVSWCLRSETLPLSLKQFARWVKQEHGGMLSVGKYKNLYFNDVLEHHPDYAVRSARRRKLTATRVCENVARASQVWVSQLQLASGSLLEFQQYIDVVQVNEESASEYESPPEPPPKKVAKRVTQLERGDDEELQVSKTCTICFEKPLKTLFANCGRSLFVAWLRNISHSVIILSCVSHSEFSGGRRPIEFTVTCWPAWSAPCASRSVRCAARRSRGRS